MISKKRKQKLKIDKELKSLKNKMFGKNIIWFESLPIKDQFSILYSWKKIKYNSIKSTKITKFKSFYGKMEETREYPASLKHFIKRCKLVYKPKASDVRDKTLEILFNSKKNKL